MNIRITRIISTVLMTLFSGISYAGNIGPYFGVGAGSSATSVKYTSGSTVDYTSSGFTIFAGNQISENMAVEAGYMSMGTFSDTSASVDLSGFGVSLVGDIPVNNTISFFGKLGLASITSTATAAPGWVLTVSPTESKFGLSFGFGAHIEASDKVTFRLAVDSYEYSAFQGNITGRTGLYTGSALFRF